MTEQNKSKADLKAGLRRWAEVNGISVPDFARKMEYSYNHAYQLLRGTYADATPMMIGKVAMAYGADAAQQILEFSDLSAEQAADVARQ
jgi:hypothetical protein